MPVELTCHNPLLEVGRWGRWAGGGGGRVVEVDGGSFLYTLNKASLTELSEDMAKWLS